MWDRAVTLGVACWLLVAAGCGDDDTSGPDGGADAGGAGPVDAGLVDGGSPDGGSLDAGPTTVPDGGATSDAGPDGGDVDPCDPDPGAGAGAATMGATTYDGTGVTMVSNVIFDASHSDDLVRVYNGHVIFDHVTFRGTGTGGTGHSLEVKQDGSVEVRNSLFEGAPVEDHIQTENNEPTVIRCNRFAVTPGEDHIDTKGGADVSIEHNTFAGSGNTLQNHNGRGRVDLIGNVGVVGAFYEDGATGSIVGNEITTRLWLYDVTQVLVADNVIALVKHGEGSSDRDPVDTYFLNNTIADAEDNGGTCYRDGNDGADPVPFCMAGAPAWYSP